MRAEMAAIEREGLAATQGEKASRMHGPRGRDITGQALTQARNEWRKRAADGSKLADAESTPPLLPYSST